MYCRMKQQLAIAIAIFVGCLPVANAIEERRRKMKIALMTAGMPWSFGPYQSQLHKLSLALKGVHDEDDVEYDLFWVCSHDPIPSGLYKSYEELRPHIPRLVPPPADFPLDHLTFLGNPNKGQESASFFNRLQQQYGFEVLVTLMDITKVVPDEPFRMPVVAWIPLHSETVSPASVDYWVLREYHGIAGLAPSGAKAIGDSVGKELELNGVAQPLRNMFGSVQVDFVPHIFDQQSILESADVALELLGDYSVAEVDSKLTGRPLIHRGQESTLESGHPHSLFGKERTDDFVILLQGGNYETEDRKGWDTSLQAFARFYKSLEDPSKIHLHIHSMEDYLIESDSNNFEEAPPSMLPKGYNIRMALFNQGIPQDAYTIDIAQHAHEVIAAYKKRASICLHPSKVEGFGMNVMECQIVGTPVVTTNFTAMGDFTKLGRSVPHRQMIRNPGHIYDMALPDVDGIVGAIGELYEEHLALTRGDEEAQRRRENEKRAFDQWLIDTCSPAAVGRKFRSLLLASDSEFRDRSSGRKRVLSGQPPTSGAYEIARGYHFTIVDWDAPWTLLAPEGLVITDPEALNRLAWMMLLSADKTQPPPMILVVPSHYEDGSQIPLQDTKGNIHKDVVLLVRTFMVTALQPRMTKMSSLRVSAIQNAQMGVKRLPEGLVVIDRTLSAGSNSRISGEL